MLPPGGEDLQNRRGLSTSAAGIISAAFALEQIPGESTGIGDQHSTRDSR